MKKIITLIVAAGLITTATFAQDHRHSYDNRYEQYSYQNQYPANNGYSYTNPYTGNWNRAGYGDKFGYNRYDRDRHARIVRNRRLYNRYYNDYRNRKGVSLQIVIGHRREY
jgi:hypothetical protein